MLTPMALLLSEPQLWQAATRHRFLDEIRAGELPRPAFDRWLAQDYHYVEALVRAQARITAGAPRPDFAVLAGGVTALVAELTWFEAQAAARTLALDAPVHPTCAAYCDHLLALTYAPYPAQITGLWAVERAYLDAWTGAQPGAAGYEPFVAHWTVPEFAAYVSGLEQAAAAALAVAAPAAAQAAAEAFRRVARHERDFWQMAYAGEVS